MRLYHSGFEVIRVPDIHHGRKNADFGQGFYLTADEAFAKRWSKPAGDRQAVINVYELDLEGLSVHRFERDLEWFSYIFSNRRGRPDSLVADVIIGPIANDTIYDTLGIITSGFLSDADALALLQVGPEYQQIVLKTEAARQHLRWLEASEMDPAQYREYGRMLEAEQERYLLEIGEKIARL